ncbi:hypothetical protein H0E86_21775 [Streptomyces sp. SCSIO-PteL053]|nr:hypothetical protein H0E86_21775 [Streptomyces sp. SCSIO-PteL053]
MRLSEDVTGWAFLAEVDGARHAGLAVGRAGLGPFTGAGPGGSLFTRAYGRGLAALASLNELPFAEPVDARWCVHRSEEGVFSVLGPGGLELAYDLGLDLPADWLETASGTGSLVLVVSHVLPTDGDMVAALANETRQGMVCAGRVRFGPPGHEAAGPPTPTYVLDPVSVLLGLVLHVRDRVLSLDAAKRRARELERVRRSLEETEEVHGLSAGALLELLVADAARSRGGAADLRYLYWRLVTEVAEECGADAVWREVALRTVESAAPVLAERCERPVFEDADELSGRLIERRGLPGRLPGPGGCAPGGRPAAAGGPGPGGPGRRCVRRGGGDRTGRPARRGPVPIAAVPAVVRRHVAVAVRREVTGRGPGPAGTGRRVGRTRERPGQCAAPRILAALAQVTQVVTEEEAEEGVGGGVDRATARAAFDALFGARAAAPRIWCSSCSGRWATRPRRTSTPYGRTCSARTCPPSSPRTAESSPPGPWSRASTSPGNVPTGRSCARYWTGPTALPSPRAPRSAGSTSRPGCTRCPTTPPTAPAPTPTPSAPSRSPFRRTGPRSSAPPPSCTRPPTPATGGGPRWAQPSCGRRHRGTAQSSDC